MCLTEGLGQQQYSLKNSILPALLMERGRGMRLQEMEGNIQEKYNLLMSNVTCYDNIFHEYFMTMLQKEWRTYVDKRT